MEVSQRLHGALSNEYRLDREIGAGGMATVYLAEDLRHRRQVAVKVLRPELSAVVGAERFLKEIEVTAGLQHPHLLPLFDSGAADGVLFYVMPYVPGESLRAMLQRERQLGVEDALRITTQVASALDYAHRRGVIHRDIKPENILLHDGQALVADFGIALALRKAGGSRLTETGLSLGTPQYMSPEQATGERELDARSDVYSLACVLYEMLAGQPPHTGPTAQSVMAKLLTEAPRPVTDLRDTVPEHVADAIDVALSKVAGDRFLSASAFAEALGNPAAAARTVRGGARVRVVRRLRRHPVAAGVAAALLLSVLAAWGMSAARRAPSSRQVMHLPIEFRNPVRTLTVWLTGAELSPAGQRIAYTSPGNQWRLMDLRDGSNRPVSTEINGNNIAFSPSGDSLALSTTAWLQQLYVIDLATGRATLLADSSAGQIRWGADGWLYYPTRPRGIRRVRVADGKREIVVPNDPAGRWATLSPVPLSNGRAMLYTRVPRLPWNPAQAEIVAVDLRTGRSHVLTRGIDAEVLDSRYLLVVQVDGTLLAARFNQRALELEGPLVPMLKGLEVRRLTEAGAAISVSRDGSLLYVEDAPLVDDTVVIVGRDGRVRRTIPLREGKLPIFRRASHIAQSPTGERWVASLHRGRTTPNIYAWTEGETELRRLTFGEILDYHPAFVPRSDDVAFVSPREGRNWDLYRVPFDGSADAALMLDRPGDIFEFRFTSDGRWVVFCEGGRLGERDVMAHRFGPDSVTIGIAATTAEECKPSVSPDGRWVAYESNETGRVEVWVREFGSPRTWQVSTTGGGTPRWSASGRELYYMSGTDQLVAVPVAPGRTFAAGAPRPLFTVGEGTLWTGETTPRDDEFMLVRVQSEAPGRVVLIRNFVEVVRARTGK